MSITNSFGAPPRGWSGSARPPLGLGARNVWFFAQYSCHWASISPAIAAVYRKGGLLAASPLVATSSADPGSSGQKKAPHAGGVAVLWPSRASARLRKEQEAPSHAGSVPRPVTNRLTYTAGPASAE